MRKKQIKAVQQFLLVSSCQHWSALISIVMQFCHLALVLYRLLLLLSHVSLLSSVQGWLCGLTCRSCFHEIGQVKCVARTIDLDRLDRPQVAQHQLHQLHQLIGFRISDRAESGWSMACYTVYVFHAYAMHMPRNMPRNRPWAESRMSSPGAVRLPPSSAHRKQLRWWPIRLPSRRQNTQHLDSI